MPEPIGQRLQRRLPSLLQRPSSAGAIARFWQRSYAADYAGILLLLILVGLIRSYVKPFHPLFRLDQQHHHYPFAEWERVPVPWLFAFALGIPSLILFVWAVSLRPPLHKVHVTYLGLFTSIFLTVFITDVLKNAVGRQRPDFNARCNPHKDTPKGSLVHYAICDQPNVHRLEDGFRSFPSGHSSFAFSGLGYLALFFAAQFRVLHPPTSLPTMLLTVLPLLGAALIAISRCEDYRHDVYDVTVGSILGMTVAWITYRRFYPSLKSLKCDTPWPSRTDIMAASAKWYARRDKDEEDRISSIHPDINGSSSKPGNPGFDLSGGESDDETKRTLLRGTSTPR